VMDSAPSTIDSQVAAKIPWHSIFPNPHSNPQVMKPVELKDLMQSGDLESGKDFLVVDVRRTDFEVSSSLYQNSVLTKMLPGCIHSGRVEPSCAFFLSDSAGGGYSSFTGASSYISL
jgi:hypothetical protein